MASSILQVRIDENLRNETNEIFHSLGLDMSSAVRLFLNRVVLSQGLPFSMNIEQPSGSLPELPDFYQSRDTRNNENAFDPLHYLRSLSESEEM